MQELKYILFGIGHGPNTGKGLHIFETDPSIKEFQFEYLFKDLELEQEQSLGQRAFAKNMDKILNNLLKFYNKYYNRQGNNNSTLSNYPSQDKQ